MKIKNFLAGLLFLCLFFGEYRIAIAESEEAAGQESENESLESGGGEAGAANEGGIESGAGSVIPGEIQRQVDNAQQTVDTVSEQAQSVKEKGLLQTIWESVAASFVALFRQIGQIIKQALSIFSA